MTPVRIHVTGPVAVVDGEPVTASGGRWRPEALPTTAIPYRIAKELGDNYMRDVVVAYLIDRALERAGLAGPVEEAAVDRARARFAGFDGLAAAKEKRFAEIARMMALFEQRYDVAIDVDRADAKAYFEAHPDEFVRSPHYRVTFLYLPLEREATEGAVEELRSLAQARAGAARRGDESFEEIAEGPKVMEPVELHAKPENMAVALAKHIPKMKPGEISEPLVSETGIYVARLEEKTPGRKVSFEEVAEELKKQLIRERYIEAKQRLLEELRREASIEWKPRNIEYRPPESSRRGSSRRDDGVAVADARLVRSEDGSGEAIEVRGCDRQSALAAVLPCSPVRPSEEPVQMTIYEIGGEPAEALGQLAALEERLQNCGAVEVVASFGSEEDSEGGEAPERIESTLNACDP